MEVGSVEVVLERIWDLHDKLSDAIHITSRAHFLNSVKDPSRKSREFCFPQRKKSAADDDDSDEPEDKNGPGFGFMREFQLGEDGPAVQEAKSLYAIRTALENLEDQLEFFRTVQIQQRAERDSAIAGLEQCRIILAMRLAEHRGRKYKVIEEAHALLGDVRNAGVFIPPEHLYASTRYPLGEGSMPSAEKKPNALGSFNFFSKLLRLDGAVGIMGNAALFALSMLALLHANRRSSQEKFMLHPEDQGKMKKCSNLLGSSALDALKPLDVMLSRG